MTTDDEAPRGWKFKKELSLDTVFATFAFLFMVGGPMLLFAMGTVNRLTVLEARNEQRDKADEVRLRQEVARDVDARDQRITVLTNMDKLTDQVTQLRIDLARKVTPEPKQIGR